MEDAKPVTQLPVKTGLVATDEIVCISNAASNVGGNVSIISLLSLFSNSSLYPVQQSDPANANAMTIVSGTMFFSNSFGYIAIANNQLRRWAISIF